MRLAAILLAVVAVLHAEEFTARVVSIADGDTITVLHDKQQIRLRLHGVDAPEKAQPFGDRARHFTGDLAHSQTVTIVERDRDRYGRTVAEVILPDGRNLNHELVRAGLARWYQRYAPGDATLERLEREARDARRGLWSDASAIAPWDWRKEHRNGAHRQRTRSLKRSERRSLRSGLDGVPEGMGLSLQALTAARHQWPVSPRVAEARLEVPAPAERAPVDIDELRRAAAEYVAATRTGKLTGTPRCGCMCLNAG